MQILSVKIPIIVTRPRGQYLAHTMGFEAVGETKPTLHAALESLKMAVRAREKQLLEIYKDIEDAK